MDIKYSVMEITIDLKHKENSLYPDINLNLKTIDYVIV